MTTATRDFYAVAFNPSTKDGGVSGYFYFTDLESAQKSYTLEVANFASECTVELVRLRNDFDDSKLEGEDPWKSSDSFFEAVSFDDLFSDRSIFDLIFLHVPEDSDAEVILPYLSQGKINRELAMNIGLPDADGFVEYKTYIDFDVVIPEESELPNGQITPIEEFDEQICVKCRVRTHIAEFVDDWSNELNRQILLGY